MANRLKTSLFWNVVICFCGIAIGGARAESTLATKVVPSRTELSSITPVCRDETSRRRHQGFVDRAKKGNIDLLFLGDSITDWWPRNGSNSWHLVSSTYRTANFGIMAERTEHLLWRISNGELDAISPKVVVILIGINNIHQLPQDEKPEWAANGIKKVVETVHEKLPGSKIVLMGLFPAGGATDWQRPGLERVNTMIEKLGDNSTIYYLNINGKFLTPTRDLKPGLFLDGLHPTSAGYAVWWASLDPLIRSLMK